MRACDPPRAAESVKFRAESPSLCNIGRSRRASARTLRAGATITGPSRSRQPARREGAVVEPRGANTMISPAPDSDETPPANEPLNWEAVSAFVQWEQALPANTRLRDYQIRGVIAESDYGIVYLAWDHSLQRRVAIKEYLPRPLASRLQDSMAVESAGSNAAAAFEAGLKAFVAEARLLARFDHAALVKVYRFWEENGTAYRVMPHLEGTTLERALVRSASPQTEAEVRVWLRPVLDAVSVMHAAHCYHHDIGPDNILLAPGGPVLLGFSAARRLILALRGGAAAAVQPGYAAPEQYSEAATVAPGPWTDLYALAAVAWRALVGHAPLPAPERVDEDRQPALASLADNRCSKAFAEAIDAALAVQPEARPHTDAEFRELVGDMEPPLPPLASATTRDLMAEPFTVDDGLREVTVPIPTQPYPHPVDTIIDDPMAQPFADTAPPHEPLAGPAVPVQSAPFSEPSLSRKVVLAIVAGVFVLGVVAAAVLYRYAGHPAQSASGTTGADPAIGAAPAARSEEAATPPTASRATAAAPVAAPRAKTLAATPAPNPVPVLAAPGPGTPPAAAPAVPAPTAAPTMRAAAPIAAPPETAPVPIVATRATPAAPMPAAEGARRIPIERPPATEAQRKSVCGDLLQEATLRRLSTAEAAFFKKECR
jgi:serine/threonine protein kinase